ncbi:hypothetical protein TA3x_002844 [Tundrisphaera sp. TA3]|uniref:hypothetical protein n=1 Tax=Tundrisphaera sp. TA3 TaxID=3435775 RepID=UPI003EB8517C
MPTQSIAALMGEHPTKTGEGPMHGVVELELLLPAHRAAALLSLARDREQTVGQVLRQMIDQELSRARSARA